MLPARGALSPLTWELSTWEHVSGGLHPPTVLSVGVPSGFISTASHDVTGLTPTPPQPLPTRPPVGPTESVGVRIALSGAWAPRSTGKCSRPPRSVEHAYVTVNQLHGAATYLQPTAQTSRAGMNFDKRLFVRQPARRSRHTRRYTSGQTSVDHLRFGGGLQGDIGSPGRPLGDSQTLSQPCCSAQDTEAEALGLGWHLRSKARLLPRIFPRGIDKSVHKLLQDTSVARRPWTWLPEIHF